MTRAEPVRVLVVVNDANDDARAVAKETANAMTAAGIRVGGLASDVAAMELDDGAAVEVLASTEVADPRRADIAIVFGGDGTILRAAEVVAPGTPLLGINLGHVGFLAEAEREDVQFVVAALMDRRWQVEERTRLRLTVQRAGEVVAESWAINEVTLEKEIGRAHV